MSAPKMVKVTVELPERDVRWLAVLNKRGAVADVLRDAAAELAEGVRRPGSWQRTATAALFAESDFLSRLEPDPGAPWLDRPRKPKQRKVAQPAAAMGGVA
jgi:hypothetical protein